MIKEIFVNLFNCAFKESMVHDIKKDQEAGIPAEEIGTRLMFTYGPDLEHLDQRALDALATQIRLEGTKYLYRDRNRMSLEDFRKAVED